MCFDYYLHTQRRSKGGAGGAARPGPQVDGGPARGPRAYLKL